MTISTVFVYGTLMPGQSRWHALGRWCTRTPPEPATALGKLYLTPYGWPAAVFDATEQNEIPGVLVQLNPGTVDAAMDELDAIEGVEADLFRRIQIATGGGVIAWAYGWPHETAAFQRIWGVWPVPAAEPIRS